MTFPSPYPIPDAGPFEVSFERLIDEVTLNVQYSRKLKLQPPLEPDNRILVGQENLAFERSAPSIVLVPLGARYRHARMPDSGEFAPLKYLSQWLEFSCHCWGQDDPKLASGGGSYIYSFSSALELFRQLMVGLIESSGGPARVTVDSSEFVQKTDVLRQGRMFVAHIAVETWLTKDSPIFAPVATPTTPGVVVSSTVAIQDPVTGLPETGATVVVP